MTRQTYILSDNGDAPTITIGVCNGDFAVTGEDERTDVAALSDRPLDAVVQDSGHLLIEWCDDLHLAVPRGTAVIVERIEGDARIEGVAAAEIAFIGGDLRLRGIAGPCAIGHVSGDAAATECRAFSLQDVGGDLRIEHSTTSAEVGRVDGDIRAVDVAHLTLGAVGGDARLEKISGTLRFAEVKGSLSLHGAVASFSPVHVGGDLSLDLAYTAGTEHQLDVEGDASIVVARDADLTLHATVSGDVAGVPTDHEDVGGTVTRRWGDGTAHLMLRVGGDLSVRSGATSSRSAPEAPVAPVAPVEDAGDGALFAVLDAVARGTLSPAEADDLLSRPRG